MDANETQLRSQLELLSRQELENVLVNYVKMNNNNAVPDSGTGNCCPAGTCGVCIGSACVKCA